MVVTLPIEVYEVLEKNFGKDDAKKVIKSLESFFGEEIINKWHKTKEELREAILKEAPTKADLENVKIKLLGEIEGLRSKTEKDKAELLGIIETTKAELIGKFQVEITRLDRKFTIMFVVLFFTIIFLNQNALEFLARIFGLVK